jgi:hypothetical protein
MRPAASPTRNALWAIASTKSAATSSLVRAEPKRIDADTSTTAWTGTLARCR